MPIANLNGATLHYDDRGGGGGGGGAPLVLVHGFPLDGRMWAAQAEALAGRSRVIVPDLRGFGRSGETGPFTIESLADDVHALADRLGLGRLVLAGLSMGGYVALAYAKKYPATLRGLILIDTKAEADPPPAREGRDKMIAQVREHGVGPVADAMLGKLIPQETATARPQLARELREMMESQRPATIAHALAAMRDRPDRSGELSAIAVPTLIVVGEKDGITPPDVMRGIHRQVAGSEMLVIPAAGHMTPMEQPEQVNRAIGRFVAALG